MFGNAVEQPLKVRKGGRFFSFLHMQALVSPRAGVSWWMGKKLTASPASLLRRWIHILWHFGAVKLALDGVKRCTVLKDPQRQKRKNLCQHAQDTECFLHLAKVIQVINQNETIRILRLRSFSEVRWVQLQTKSHNFTPSSSWPCQPPWYSLCSSASLHFAPQGRAKAFPCWGQCVCERRHRQPMPAAIWARAMKVTLEAQPLSNIAAVVGAHFPNIWSQHCRYSVAMWHPHVQNAK